MKLQSKNKLHGAAGLQAAVVDSPGERRSSGGVPLEAEHSKMLYSTFLGAYPATGFSWPGTF